MAQKHARRSVVARSVQEVREEYRQLMEGALERIYKKNRPQPDGHYPNFAEREELAVSLGREITEFFMEVGFLEDPRYQEIIKAEIWPCPDCNTASRKAMDGKGQVLMDEVILDTRAGQVPFSGPFFRCTKCRRNFSPLKKFLGAWPRKQQYGDSAESELGRR